MELEKVTWLQPPHIEDQVEMGQGSFLSEVGVGGMVGVWCWGRAGPPVAHFLPMAEDLLGAKAQER